MAVARANGFRQAARTLGTDASRLSDTARRVEASLGVRLFNRITRMYTHCFDKGLQSWRPAIRVRGCQIGRDLADVIGHRTEMEREAIPMLLHHGLRQCCATAPGSPGRQ